MRSTSKQIDRLLKGKWLDLYVLSGGRGKVDLIRFHSEVGQAEREKQIKDLRRKKVPQSKAKPLTFLLRRHHAKE